MHLEEYLDNLIRIDKEQMLNHLLSFGLIQTFQLCSCCEMQMMLRKSNDNIDGYEYRCLTKHCRKFKHTRSVRVGSMLENMIFRPRNSLKF